MPSKGQTFNRYSAELKHKVLEEYFNGEAGYASLSEKYGIPVKTVKTWVDCIRYPERHPGLGNKKGRRKDSDIDWKERYEILKKYRAFLKARRERK